MANRRRYLLLLLVGTILSACGRAGEIPAGISSQALLAELQESVRHPSHTCPLESNGGETDELIQWLLLATAADVVSIRKPTYVLEPAVELVIRAPRSQNPRAHLLSVLVHLENDQCEKFDLAEIKD